MKFSRLVGIVSKYAHEQRECARYNGAWNDGGSGATLAKLEVFKRALVSKYDFRPSEYHKLNSIDVGEPQEFSEIIKQEKIRMANSIEL